MPGASAGPDATPQSRSAPQSHPAGASREGGCAAPRRSALSSVPSAARPASPDAGAYSESRRPRGRSPSRATECPRPSPRHLPQTQLREATAAAPRASPQPLSLHVTSGLGPAPARQSQWTFGPADRGSRWESESSACARSGRHSDGCCWHSASFRPRCHLRLFSEHIPFLQALFLYPMELLPQSVSPAPFLSLPSPFLDPTALPVLIICWEKTCVCRRAMTLRTPSSNLIIGLALHIPVFFLSLLLRRWGGNCVIPSSTFILMFIQKALY